MCAYERDVCPQKKVWKMHINKEEINKSLFQPKITINFNDRASGLQIMYFRLCIKRH